MEVKSKGRNGASVDVDDNAPVPPVLPPLLPVLLGIAFPFTCPCCDVPVSKCCTKCAACVCRVCLLLTVGAYPALLLRPAMLALMCALMCALTSYANANCTRTFSTVKISAPKLIGQRTTRARHGRGK